MTPSSSSSVLQAPEPTVRPKVQVDGALKGTRAAVLVFSSYPEDPRPRRATHALVAAGMEVEMLCIDDGGDHRQGIVDGVRVHRLAEREGRGGKLSYIIQYFHFLWKGFRFLSAKGDGRGYDLVHVHNMPDFLVFAAVLPRLLGAKIILDLHDPMPELMKDIYRLRDSDLFVRFVSFVERLSIAFSDQAITPNLRFKKLFVGRGCPPWKMSIVMNSPDERIFSVPADAKPRRRARDSFRIMHHGSILHRHGVDLLVRAVAIVRRSVPGVQLDIHGASTEFLDTVMEEVTRLGLQDCVHYRGRQSQAEIARAILDCDLGVVPNRPSSFINSNFPTRLFEYLAMDRPVIAPHTPGIRDYFDEEQMIYFEAGDVEDLAQMILWVWANPEQAAARVAAGREVYQQHLWSMEKQRFLGLVEGLLQDSREPSVI